MYACERVGAVCFAQKADTGGGEREGVPFPGFLGPLKQRFFLRSPALRAPSFGCFEEDAERKEREAFVFPTKMRREERERGVRFPCNCCYVFSFFLVLCISPPRPDERSKRDHQERWRHSKIRSSIAVKGARPSNLSATCPHVSVGCRTLVV